jgi:hypothetical protein
MRKTEIIQLVFIVLGISIIINALASLFEQITIYAKFSGETSIEFSWIAIGAVVLILIFLIGFLLIFKSGLLAKKISKDEDVTAVNLTMSKNDVIHIAIIILCLFFAIKLFPSFLSTIYLVIMAFVNDFSRFKDLFPQQIWALILYLLILIILFNSHKFSNWLQSKMLK